MNLTLRNMRVAWFQRGGVNGVFATGNGSGTLTLDGVELDHNGGPNGPAHNIYVNASVVDPLYGVVMTRSWSHDAFYGHLFKSRAQSTSLIGDYFRGGLPQPGKNVAESYLIDISNGGILDLRDSILTKTQSGALSNATMIDFGGEGIVDSRTQSVDIENNDFVAFSATNGGGAALTPMGFFSPRVVPGGTGWPIGVATQIIKNAFVGVCGSPYQGDISVNEAFSELSKTFALSTKIDSDEATLGTNFPGYVTVLGQPTYRQNTALGPVRIVPTIGAQN